MEALGALGVHPVGYEMSQVVLAMMVFWDIPCGFMVKVLREPLMLVHHFGMAFVALLGFVRATCSRSGSMGKDWFDRAGLVMLYVGRNVLSVKDFTWAKEHFVIRPLAHG